MAWQARTELVAIRTTPVAKVQLRTLAQAAGLSLSDYIREALQERMLADLFGGIPTKDREPGA